MDFRALPAGTSVVTTTGRPPFRMAVAVVAG